MPVLPERFANDPLQAISSRCKFAVLLGDSKTQPGVGGVVGPEKDGKQLVATSPCIPEDATVGVLVGQAAAAPETVIGCVALRCASFRDEQYVYVCVTASALRGLWHDDASVRDGQPWLPSLPGIHVCEPALACWAEMFVSL